MEIQRDDLLAARLPRMWSELHPARAGKLIMGKVLAMYSGVNFGGPQTGRHAESGRGRRPRSRSRACHRRGRQEGDRIATRTRAPTISCPIRNNGLMFVFRVFDRVSYAHDHAATTVPVVVGDVVRTP
jgi:hypothetical protein